MIRIVWSIIWKTGESILLTVGDIMEIIKIEQEATYAKMVKKCRVL